MRYYDDKSAARLAAREWTGERRAGESARDIGSRGTGAPVRTALLIAFHYPPCQESSGYLRTLSFSRRLPQFGWQPIVLTAHPRAYPQVREDQCRRIPASLPLKRAFALDARRHLSVRRRYPGFLALPDRWSSWWLGAVPAGLALIRRYRPDVIWATQPILTAFNVARSLHRLTGIPWVADFRDPVVPDGSDGFMVARARRRAERAAVADCARAVFTAPGAAHRYAERFPDRPPEHWAVISNGYDEADFAPLDELAPPSRARPVRLVHSGLLYPENRDPQPLLEAIARLKATQRLSAHDLQLVLRASGYEERYLDSIRRLGIGDIVHLAPPLPYAQALRELRMADALLVIQGDRYDGQIPTKIYEYLRVRRPILALVGETGDTARVLRRAGIDTLAPAGDSGKIAAMLPDFLDKVQAGTAPLADDAAIAGYERGAQCEQLAQLFDELAAAGSAHTEQGRNK